MIFADGFESGDFSAWFGLNTGNGDLYVCAAAAMEGSYGACVDVVSQKRKQMWDQSMTDASRYRTRFYFDPNGLSMGNNEKIRLMQLRTGVDTIRPAFVQVRYIGGGYEIRMRAQTDAGVTLSGSWYPIADAAVAIEIDWMAATGDGDDNGYVTLWLNGVEMGTISGIDNDTLRVNEVKLGFTSRLGTKIISGTFYLDAFVSTLADYIGLLP